MVGFTLLVPQQLDRRELVPENEAEARLLAQRDVAGEPRHIDEPDELCRATRLPVAAVAAVAAVSSTLVMLELKGLVRLAGPMTSMRAR
jgi:hypothetical protein